MGGNTSPYVCMALCKITPREWIFLKSTLKDINCFSENDFLVDKWDMTPLPTLKTPLWDVGHLRARN